MSKEWYPVIDYVNCAECGSCIDMCGHGVYDVAKAPTPIVINGDRCFEGCHGCGELCPTGAITYAGDETGWTPPIGEDGNNDSGGCGCGCGGNC